MQARSIDRDERLCSGLTEAVLLVDRARSHEQRGGTAEALVSYDLALASLDGMPPLPLLVDILRWKGMLLREEGARDAAEALYRRALMLGEQIHYVRGVARVEQCLAVLGHDQHATSRALDASPRHSIPGRSR